MTDICIDLQYTKSGIPVNVLVQTSNKTLYDYTCYQSETIDIVFCKNESLDKVCVSLHCLDNEIYLNPVFITNIVLDDFYNHKKLIYTTDYSYSDDYIQWAKQKNISLSKEYNNTLFFTGSISYTFVWPFFRNQFT